MPQCFVSGKGQFVSPKIVKDRLKEMHARIFPETSVVVKNLVSEKISHGCKFIERTVPVERA